MAPYTITIIQTAQISYPPKIYVPFIISDGTNSYYWAKTINSGVVPTNLQAMLDNQSVDIWTDASLGTALTQQQINNPDGTQAFFVVYTRIIQKATDALVDIGGAQQVGSRLYDMSLARFDVMNATQKAEVLRKANVTAMQILREMLRFELQDITPENYIPPRPDLSR